MRALPDFVSWVTHETKSGKARKTYGHSLVVSPWGAVLADAETAQGITYVEIDLKDVSKARMRIPALTHDVDYDRP